MNPYKALPGRNYWAQAVGNCDPMEISDLWVPKWRVTPDDSVVTFGSCFAQHFGKALQARGYGWTNYEPAPEGLAAEAVERFNYATFSARTGNIYTANILRQWCDWAAGKASPPDEVWEKEGRFFDPFRPAIEPKGFESAEEMRRSRQRAIRAFREAIEGASVFVFTLGLTESWRHVSGEWEYAVCPGTVAGRFDPNAHVFVNEIYPNILNSLELALQAMRELNPDLRLLLTVSPVPLTATATQDHVLVATTHSKSILRAVAGAMAAAHPMVDYFPSYEIISAPVYGGRFFAENRRGVQPEGVAHVMGQFFGGQVARFGEPPARRRAVNPARKAADLAREAQLLNLVCEEEILANFGPRT